ncbi:MAG: 4-amino-4-deoxy-L-arabinose transferase-like glycosyltransferase [Cyclobacteriaceae bacterium]|jgi:4-amino-4-deoxy-L-arabinose transferase-like glycosyltransferase
MFKSNVIQRLAASNQLVFLVLLGLAAIMRLHTYFPLTIDYDETTYALMADQMLQGDLLYRDVIDIKQPGIFLIFAFLQLVFGKSVLAIRLFAMLTIASSGYLLYRIKRQLGFAFSPSLASGVVYVLMFNFYFGFSANTEVFFIASAVLGMYLYFCLSSNWRYLLAGLAFGVGFIIKQHVIFDFAAWGLFLLIISISSKCFKRDFMWLSLAVLGFLLPYAIVHIYYLWIDQYAYYHFVSYVAPGNYSSARDWLASTKFIIDGLIVYLPFVLLGMLALKGPKWPKNTFSLFFLLLIFDLIAISATGQLHPHYYLQLAIPISWLAGQIVTLQWVKGIFQKRLAWPVIVLAFIIYGVLISNFYYKRYFVKPNRAEQFVAFLGPLITDSTTIYTGDAPQFLYWYFDKKSPTPYIHSSLMLQDSHIQTLDIDVKEELDRIYSDRPDLIILSKNYRYQWFQEQVRAEYQIVGEVSKYEIYSIK